MSLQKICVHLKNCYGIGKLDHEFKIKENTGNDKYAYNVHAIYASNGIMKTSFAKTFEDQKNGKDSEDLIYPERDSSRKIINEIGSPIKEEEIYVIKPYVQFDDNKITLLLATKELKDEYDNIHAKIDAKKEDFIGNIKKSSKIRNNEENENIMLETFGENDFYICLDNIKNDISELNNHDLAEIKYKQIFHPDVLEFLKKEENKKLLSEYIDKFNELIEKSEYFKKGAFTHTNASKISDNLESNGFFKAKHIVKLKSEKSESGDRLIQSGDDFRELIDSEKEIINTNPELIEKFEKIDTAITKNKNLNDFRSFLENNRTLIPKLMNLDEFKNELWLSYIKKEEILYAELLDLYHDAKGKIDKITRKAKNQTTKWEEVINKFNERFFVPFEIRIKNKEDVILREKIATSEFIFKGHQEDRITTEENLLKVLSEGEKRALYLLNIIYEVETRKNNQQKTIFIVDDIADTFDYKNKYAILEYLIDVSQEDFFYEIILTHNFDFFRTLNSRFVPDKNCYMAEKDGSKVVLKEAKDIKMPIKKYVRGLCNNQNYTIAIIPFIRNIIEYTKGNQDKNYELLTSMLHIKERTDSLTVRDLEFIIQTELNDNNLILNNSDKKILDAIWECSESCLKSKKKTLDEKLVLSIGIRLQAEKFMIEKIDDNIFLTSIKRNQTVTLFREYKNRFNSDRDSINLLEKVNLMTPENIHLNSFMYEPIIDMSGDHLINLYKNVRDLNSSKSEN
jgi:hypothetical protein